jgi:hypothetical protein
VPQTSVECRRKKAERGNFSRIVGGIEKGVTERLVFISSPEECVFQGER